MNAAIDQQCELYIRQNGMEAEVKQKIKAFFKSSSQARRLPNSKLPGARQSIPRAAWVIEFDSEESTKSTGRKE